MSGSRVTTVRRRGAAKHIRAATTADFAAIATCSYQAFASFAAYVHADKENLHIAENVKDGSLQFYQSHGFRETGRCDDDGHCREFYTKKLQPLTLAVV